MFRPPLFSKSLIPKNIIERITRISYILIAFLKYPFLIKSTYTKVINSYREFLSQKMGILPIDINSLTDWNRLNLKLISPTNNAGQVTHLELLVITGVIKSFLKPGQNFLEIGTFDGNTTINVAKNISQKSKVITIDLPENTSIIAKFTYDNLLIKNQNRSKNKTPSFK